jgi:AmmeMemoRadiSam system protein A
VFVTLRERDGALRGCIGHVEPMHDTLAEEVASCAVSSALRDSRFAPVGAEELATLSIEVSVLDKPEPVETAAQLEPRTYGVIVSAGSRRGVLLPDIEGVDSVEQQLKIALHKAGIDAAEAFRVERFQVLKAEEPFHRSSDLGLH